MGTADHTVRRNLFTWSWSSDNLCSNHANLKLCKFKSNYASLKLVESFTAYIVEHIHCIPWLCLVIEAFCHLNLSLIVILELSFTIHSIHNMQYGTVCRQQSLLRQPCIHSVEPWKPIYSPHLSHHLSYIVTEHWTLTFITHLRLKSRIA